MAASGEAGAGVRLLATGSAGRLGRMLRRVWAVPPVGIVPLWQARHAAPGVIGWDMLSGPWPDGAPAPDIVLNLAGVANGTGSAQALADNTALALAACQMAARAGARHVFLASSGAVYGPTPAGGGAEGDAPAPANAYGAAKLAMERAALAWASAAGPRAPAVTCLRIGNVAGADALLGSGRAEITLDDFPDRPGEGPLRSYIGPVTLARVLAALARKAGSGAPLPERLNIATPAPVTMGALARAAGLGVTLHPAHAGAVARVVLDTTRLEALVPFAAADSSADAMVAEWRGVRGGGA